MRDNEKRDDASVVSTAPPLTTVPPEGDQMAASKPSAKAPAFQFYPNDFLSDPNVMVMSLQERGAYITLICVCWTQGVLPDDKARLARLCGTPANAFTKIWPALESCFRKGRGGLVHPRLEREREKQAEFKRLQADRATKRWDKKNHAAVMPRHTSGTVPRNADPHASGNALQSSSSSASSSSGRDGTADARSGRPIFRGQRFVVFEWMLDDLRRLLGSHTDGFDLHAWFFDLDAQLVAESFVVPQRDGGRWLQDRTLAEAIRRGLPLAAQPSTGKTAGNAAAAARFIARGQA
jgi:uncharacterized protein YdaU (DUF1376 family)